MNEQSRRQFLQLSAAGMFGVSMSGWLDVLAAHAANNPVKAGQSKHKSCILLWMDGGPSHKDTFDLKPGTKDGGEFKPIDTSVSGLQISEHFEKLARLMQHGVVIRSMSTGEGAHGRAKYYLHTGYKEGVGGLNYPSIGSIVSSEIGNADFPMPNFVSIGNRSYGAGFLGARHQPLIVTDPAKGVEDLKPLVSDRQFNNRVDLLDEMESGFFRTRQATSIKDHQTTYQRAVRMMQSKEVKAFDLASEEAKARAAYGSSKFAEGCLLARRLVETGVPFVEVTLGGWDTHQDNFTRVKSLSQTVDQALSALLTDLKDRGLLDSTLVIWMGEFGRTPKINSRGDKPGRDHYPKAWSMAMFGGGIKGGQVIGSTDAEGALVKDRPVSAIDFMATVCKVLGIDFTKNNEANGRPIRIADRGAKPIEGLI
jgi:hypothetical protein